MDQSDSLLSEMCLTLGRREESHLDLLDLSLESTDIRITLRRRLVQLHHVDGRVDVVPENPDHGVALVVHQDRTPRFEQVFVDKRHDRDVALPTAGTGDDGVVVVDDLF